MLRVVGGAIEGGATDGVVGGAEGGTSSPGEQAEELVSPAMTAGADVSPVILFRDACVLFRCAFAPVVVTSRFVTTWPLVVLLSSTPCCGAYFGHGVPNHPRTSTREDGITGLLVHRHILCFFLTADLSRTSVC